MTKELIAVLALTATINTSAPIPIEPPTAEIIHIGLTDTLLTAEVIAAQEEAERQAEFEALVDSYEAEIYVMAQMLTGECYPDNEADQRNAAITVCNRCDKSGRTITDIIMHTGFYGWHSYNVPSKTNLRVAREVVSDWLAIKQGETREWAAWLSFRGGVGYSNVYFERWI